MNCGHVLKPKRAGRRRPVTVSRQPGPAALLCLGAGKKCDDDRLLLRLSKALGAATAGREEEDEDEDDDEEEKDNDDGYESAAGALAWSEAVPAPSSSPSPP